MSRNTRLFICSRTCAFVAICVFSFGSNAAQAATGYYMGGWASDLAYCKDRQSPQRIEVSQFEIVSASFHCKLLGLREQDKISFTFMAACNDQNVRWNDEIKIQPEDEKLLIRMKSDGKDMTFKRCP